MDQHRLSDESLFEALRIPPLLGLAILFALWCLIAWYLWTATRNGVRDRLAAWRQRVRMVLRAVGAAGSDVVRRCPGPGCELTACAIRKLGPVLGLATGWR